MCRKQGCRSQRLMLRCLSLITFPPSFETESFPEPEGPVTCLHHAGVTGLCLHPFLLHGFWGSELRPSCLCSKHVTLPPNYLPSSLKNVKNAQVYERNNKLSKVNCPVVKTCTIWAYFKNVDFWHYLPTFVPKKLLLKTFIPIKNNDNFES